ncbi:hypothetical protein [Taklimakanibacter deserti]|uniref:hypothetical protein n=1 Tax=Taklimakanibacter deserti TaxID=2267839 RepID=UPI0013C3FD71
MKLASFEVPANVDVILWLIHKCPGLSESEIADRLFGRDVQQLVNGDVRLLLNKELIERRGEGPFRLYPV